MVAACCAGSAITALVLRFYLAAENKRRDAEPHDDAYDAVYVTGVTEDGSQIEKKVDRVSFLHWIEIWCVP